ncbi:ABC transporter substrate-binding protein [Paenibacillus sp. V4I7]|uniref:ABC transporter substrate-binding protein n=1 Tax=Paenibacillus sp. V4I7 TaxID=3042307 RepID=UPI00277F9109|nr:extracellular solute-binding protein [Paenibacillus sp. V4I7]MDQ0899122.1 raffinose/stachyose/melibiose transport system substrate-binding protein [Paenibacillus sp. V4I7]
MKKYGHLMLSVIMLIGVILSGCTKEENSGNAASEPKKDGSAAPPQQVTITMWNRLGKTTFDSVIAGFQQKYPNIMVKLENMPEGGGDVAQFQAAINGNELPDVFVRPTGYTISQLVKLGKVHSLNEVFPANTHGNYTDGTFAEGYGSIGGTVYTFPLYSSLHGALMMYYNKKVLGGLGYTEADIPKSWDEFITFGKELNKKSGGKTYALAFGAATNYLSTFLLNQLSAPITPESGFNYKTGQYNYNTQGYIETMQYLKKAYDQKVLHPATIDADTGKAYSLIKTGEAAFMIGGNWSGDYLSSDDKGGAEPFTAKDWGVVPIPSKNGGPQFQYFEGGSGESLYVSKETKHWPEVKTFLEYLNENMYAEVVKSGQTLPSKKIELVKGAEPRFEQYKKISQMMVEFKRLTPTVYKKNPAATEVMSQYRGYAPKENIGTIFLGYLQGQLKDLEKPLQKLTEDNNNALKRAIGGSGGAVKPEDFIFSDWVPGENYKK